MGGTWVADKSFKNTMNFYLHKRSSKSNHVCHDGSQSVYILPSASSVKPEQESYRNSLMYSDHDMTQQK